MGTISHKAASKIDINKLDRFIQDLINFDHDFDFAHFAVKDQKLIFNIHPHFQKIWKDCFEPLVGPAKNYNESMFNYWIARKHYFKNYCDFLQKKILNQENPRSLLNHPLINTDSKYPLIRPKNQLKILYGYEYYTHHPFLLERFAFAYFTFFNYKNKTLQFYK